MPTGRSRPGCFVSSAAGNVPTTHIDVSQTYWDTSDEAPLPPLDRDVTYELTTANGERFEIVAKLAEDFGRLDLHYRNKERTEAYEDRLVFCTYEIPATGEVGNGVLEVGKHLRGADAVAQLRRPAAGVA